MMMSWAPVTNALNMAVEAKASLRWWAGGSANYQVKGLVKLQRFGDTPVFCLIYTGNQVTVGGAASVHGAIYIPLDSRGGVAVQCSALGSTNTRANAIKMSFGPNADNLDAIQLIIPFSNDEQNDTGLIFAEAIRYVVTTQLESHRG